MNMTYEKIKENEVAIIQMAKTSEGSISFEVFIKILANHGKFKGQILNPNDEDFGIWAWSFYTQEMAEKCYQEITEGKRTITPMVEL